MTGKEDLHIFKKTNLNFIDFITLQNKSNSLSISPNNKPSILLKGVLSISSSESSLNSQVLPLNEHFNSQVEVKNEAQLQSQLRSYSPTSILPKKNLSPESKNSRLNNSSSVKKAKKRPSPSPSSLPTSTSTSTNISKNFYAGSDFMNSPDPLTIPIPNFDDVDDFFAPSSAPNVSSFPSSANVVSFSSACPAAIEDKTSALRRLLQVK